jgi:hypothetical protein
VFPCSGSTTLADVLKGIDWIIKDHKKGDPAVANFSLGGEKSELLDFWIQELIKDGVHVIAASGNSNQDSCNFSPAGTPNVITVNSSGKTDAVSDFSNYGACSDIFAPGEGIISAGIRNPKDAATSSGTSMSSPFVAGAVAKLLQTNPSYNSAQVLERLLSSATPYVSIHSNDAARMLYSSSALIEEANIEAARIAAEQAAAAEAARIAAAAEAARVAAEQAAAAEAARVAASLPVVRKSLQVKTLKKKRLSVSIAAPAGSTTVIQRKVGKKWKTVTVRQQVGKKWKKVRVAETLPSSTIRVPRAGTYRVQITIPSGKITTKSYRVR